jgi:hypothetical protein
MANTDCGRPRRIADPDVLNGDGIEPSILERVLSDFDRGTGSRYGDGALI